MGGRGLLYRQEMGGEFGGDAANGEGLVLPGGRVLPRSASKRVLELSSAGKTLMQVSKNYSLADYDLGVEDVKFVLENATGNLGRLSDTPPRHPSGTAARREAAPAAVAGSHSGEKLDKTYRYKGPRPLRPCCPFPFAHCTICLQLHVSMVASEA